MIFIGKIFKVRGNKGEVAIASPSMEVHALAVGGWVTLKSEKYEKKYEVDYLREINGNPVIKLKGIDAINEALKLVGYSVYTEPGEKGNNANIPTTDSEDAEMDGFQVRDLNGEPWGHVTGFETGGYNKLLEVQDEDEPDVYYVPFTETIVKEIDREKRLIIIDPPDGLKSLNKK